MLSIFGTFGYPNAGEGGALKIVYLFGYHWVGYCSFQEFSQLPGPIASLYVPQREVLLTLYTFLGLFGSAIVLFKSLVNSPGQ